MAETRLSRWDPFRELGLESAFRDWGTVGSPLSRLVGDLFAERPSHVSAVAPAVDIVETNDEYVVTAEVPGVKKNDLTLEVHEGVLTIRGEKRSQRDEESEKGRWLERSYGTFSRSFSLPSDADPDRISASFEDGVLTVRLPKTPEAKPRTIHIRE